MPFFKLLFPLESTVINPALHHLTEINYFLHQYSFSVWNYSVQVDHDGMKSNLENIQLFALHEMSENCFLKICPAELLCIVKWKEHLKKDKCLVILII